MLRNLIDFFYHIDMILSILNLNVNSFVFRFFPEKTLYQLNVIYVYILISLPIPNRQISIEPSLKSEFPLLRLDTRFT